MLLERLHPRDIGDFLYPASVLCRCQVVMEESPIRMSQKSSCDLLLDKFQKLVERHFIHVKYFGFGTLDSNSSVFLKCLYNLYGKLILLNLWIIMTTLFFDLCASIHDINIFTNDGCMLAGGIIVLFKTALLHVRREQMIQLLKDTIENCHQLCKFPIGGEKKIIKRYLYINYVVMCGFVVQSFFLLIGMIFTLNTKNKDLPFRGLYPFDTTKSPWYEIILSLDVCMFPIAMIVITSMEGMYVNICTLFLVNLEILNMHFEKCSSQHNAPDCSKDRHHSNTNCKTITLRKISSFRVPFAKENCGKDNDEDNKIYYSFTRQYIRSIWNHQRMLVIINEFNKIYSFTSFVQMFSSIIMICLTGYQITLIRGEAGESTYKFCMYLVAALIQILGPCWIGNEVTSKNDCLSQSQWLSKWDDELSADTKCLLVLSILYTKRTLNLKAGSFYVLSLKTFMSIVQGAYSFFAVLHQRSEDD